MSDIITCPFFDCGNQKVFTIRQIFEDKRMWTQIICNACKRIVKTVNDKNIIDKKSIDLHREYLPGANGELINITTIGAYKPSGTAGSDNS